MRRRSLQGSRPARACDRRAHTGASDVYPPVRERSRHQDDVLRPLRAEPQHHLGLCRYPQFRPRRLLRRGRLHRWNPGAEDGYRQLLGDPGAGHHRDGSGRGDPRDTCLPSVRSGRGRHQPHLFPAGHPRVRGVALATRHIGKTGDRGIDRPERDPRTGSRLRHSRQLAGVTTIWSLPFWSSVRTSSTAS